MSLSPLTFSGISGFSEDFQMLLNRSFQIASLPVKQLQNQQADLLTRKLQLSNLSSAAAGVAAQLQALGAIGERHALAASSSDTSKVTAQNVNSSSAATYTIGNIESVARVASESSLGGYASSTATPVSSTGLLELVVGEQSYDIDLTGEGKNNLTALRDAINQKNAGVTATVLTTGTGANPYYLSVTANVAGATALALRDDPSGANPDLLSAANQGANTVFRLNGVPVSKPSALINDVVPGVTFTILGTTSGEETVTVSIGTSRAEMAAGLANLVDSYNGLLDEVNGQVGPSAGMLSGDFLVREVQDAMRALASIAGTGSMNGLADLGIEFDNNGKAEFSRNVFDDLSESRLLEAVSFFGTAATGLGAAAARFTSISDPLTGLAKLQQDRYEETDKRLSSQIATLNERISASQAALAAKLQAADALLGQLQSQQLSIEASLKGLSLTLYGRNEDR